MVLFLSDAQIENDSKGAKTEIHPTFLAELENCVSAARLQPDRGDTKIVACQLNLGVIWASLGNEWWWVGTMIELLCLTGDNMCHWLPGGITARFTITGLDFQF